MVHIEWWKYLIETLTRRSGCAGVIIVQSACQPLEICFGSFRRGLIPSLAHLGPDPRSLIFWKMIENIPSS